MISSVVEKLKNAAWEAASFTQLVVFIVHAMLGVRLLVLPAIMLAQDLTSPAVAQHQISEVQADLRRHERKIDGLTSSVHGLIVEMAVLSKHIENAEKSREKSRSTDWADSLTLMLLFGLLGDRGVALYRQRG